MINSNFRKRMADSWFSYLQNKICKEFEFLENNKYKFLKREWKKDKKKKVAVHHIFYQEEKFLIRWE